MVQWLVFHQSNIKWEKGKDGMNYNKETFLWEDTNIFRGENISKVFLANRLQWSYNSDEKIVVPGWAYENRKAWKSEFERKILWGYFKLLEFLSYAT